ncbi:hypothetical protein GPALN_010447 [Globodera pallida]|nr:hypothetical protein GPALN_010447 [Globodera pallida]
MYFFTVHIISVPTLQSRTLQCPHFSAHTSVPTRQAKTVSELKEYQKEQRQNIRALTREDKKILKILNMTSHNAFAKFMEDRDAIERFRNQIFFFLGEPKGDPSPGYPGLYADKALPH